MRAPPDVVAVCRHATDTNTQGSWVTSARFRSGGLDLQVEEPRLEQHLGRGRAPLTIGLQRVDERRQIRRRHEGVVVDQADVVEGVEITEGVVVGGKAQVLGHPQDAHIGEGLRDQIRAAIPRAVVDEHQLEAILRPFQRVEMFETANEVVPPVEGQHHQPDAGPGHVDHLSVLAGKTRHW